jgi:hypothetical protein
MVAGFSYRDHVGERQRHRELAFKDFYDDVSRLVGLGRHRRHMIVEY